MPFSHSARQLANTCANQWWFNRLLKIAFFFFFGLFNKVENTLQFYKALFSLQLCHFLLCFRGKSLLYSCQKESRRRTKKECYILDSSLDKLK